MTEYKAGDLVKIKGFRGVRGTGKVWKDHDPLKPLVTVIVDGQFRDFPQDQIEPLKTLVYTGGDRRKSKTVVKKSTRRTQII